MHVMTTRVSHRIRCLNVTVENGASKLEVRSKPELGCQLTSLKFVVRMSVG